MPPRLTTDYAKNYCNRALIVKVIVENVVTCFLLGHSVYSYNRYCYIINNKYLSVYGLTEKYKI